MHIDILAGFVSLALLRISKACSLLLKSCTIEHLKTCFINFPWRLACLFRERSKLVYFIKHIVIIILTLLVITLILLDLNLKFVILVQ